MYIYRKFNNKVANYFSLLFHKLCSKFKHVFLLFIEFLIFSLVLYMYLFYDFGKYKWELPIFIKKKEKRKREKRAENSSETTDLNKKEIPFKAIKIVFLTYPTQAIYIDVTNQFF